MARSVTLRPGGTSPLTIDGEVITFNGEPITATPTAVHEPTVTLVTGSTTVILEED